MLSCVRFVGMCVMFNILLSTIVTSMYVFTGVLHVACLCMSPCLCFVDMFVYIYNCVTDTVICLKTFALSSSLHHFSSSPLNCLGK